MEIVNQKIENYCEQHTDPESSVLAAINRETHANFLKPRMLSGHFQGRLLSLISKLVKPLNILEIGSFTGYSALCLAEGLQTGGKLYTIEADEELAGTIQTNIDKAGYSDRIELITGEALDIIPSLNINFDLIFIDADKMNYLNYYKLTIDKLNIGGVILSDNVLWSGKVSNEDHNDSTTKLLREFNDFLAQDKRTEKVLLPIRDGLFLSMKIK